MFGALLAVGIAASQITWNGVTLGAPASTLRAVLGDPLRIITSDDGTARIARYWIPTGSATYFLVLESRGYVTGFDAFSEEPPSAVLSNVPADPSGVSLGQPIDSVKAAHPDFTMKTEGDGTPMLIGALSPVLGAAYEFSNGRTTNFHWAMRLSQSDPELAPLTMPSGDAVATAILDMMHNETGGVAWEYRYLAFHPCDKETRWHLVNQALLHEGGRAYDRLHVVCPTTKAERDFFFDITPFFGKL